MKNKKHRHTNINKQNFGLYELIKKDSIADVYNNKIVYVSDCSISRM